MSDIVERLRGVQHNILADMTRDAADEIERLSAELAAALRALQKAHDAMVLAQTSHNRVLTCDPPIDAWKHRCVDVHLGEAIRECAAAMRKEGGGA